MSKTQPTQTDAAHLYDDYEPLDSYDTAAEEDADTSAEDDADPSAESNPKVPDDPEEEFETDPVPEDENETDPAYEDEDAADAPAQDDYEEGDTSEGDYPSKDDEDEYDFSEEDDLWENPAPAPDDEELEKDLQELQRARDAAEYARKMREQRAGAVHVQRVILIILGAAAGVLAAAYAAGLIYFSGHFAFHTTLNGTDVSCQNASQAESLIAQAADSYTLTIHGRNQVDGTIRGTDISLVLTADTSAADLIHSQSSLLWPKSLWTQQALTDPCQAAYDEAALEALVDALPFFASENIQQPSNAVCSYTDGSFQITAGDPGSVPRREAILSAVRAAVSANQTELTLDDDCYEEAAVTEDSTELLAAQDELNKILNLTITMTFGEDTQTLSKDQLASFVSVSIGSTDAASADNTADDQGASDDTAAAEASSEETEQTASSEDDASAEDAQDTSSASAVVYDAEAVTAYVASLAEQYDTYGKDREFKTHSGDTVTVSGGNYGWQMDQEATAASLIETLKAEEDAEFTPVWTKEAASFGDTDIGTSYMEVDLDHQKVYQYIDGECVVETDCVSGKAIDSDRLTPDGTYSIVYRKSPAVLKGADYESPVTYWMPFNGGIGFHDATWRSKFGGELYLTGGSHGCINLPLSAAKAIYANVYSGMPVVVYGGMTAEEAIAYTGKKPDPPVTKKESESDIGGGISDSDTDPANAAAVQQAEAQAAAAEQQAAQQAVIAQAQQNYMDQGMSAEQAAAQVQADLAAQLAAQQAAAGQ